MITTHSSAHDYCSSILDHVGAPRIVRDGIEQRYGHAGEKDASDPRGILMFATPCTRAGLGEMEAAAQGHTMAQVAYTLPIEASELRYRIIRAYDPDALRWMRARDQGD